MNIFEALREDHDKQRSLINSLIETHGDTMLRDTFFQRIKKELRNGTFMSHLFNMI